MKIAKKLIVLTVLLSAAGTATAQPEMIPDAGIIPAPVKIEFLSGQFLLDERTEIFCQNSGAKAAATFLQAELKSRNGWELPLARSGKEGVRLISLEIDAHQKMSAESYELEVTTNGTRLRAATPAGLFYGVQSLLQMVDSHSGANRGAVALPAVSIADAPRFEWRGFLLDESDHFYGKQTVEEILDLMAYLKLNRFHWHLTDDYGWRVEIKRYPRLTQIGASRNFEHTNTEPQFYSHNEVREIVEYARRRHIVIVPEIDMPGHATAATMAYPEIGEGGTGHWAGYTFHPAKPETYDFLKNILREVCDLFPGQYIHLGGDEVWFGNRQWTNDPAIVKFTRDLGYTNSVQLEGYFNRRMAGIVHDLGRTPLGWDELVAADADPEYTGVFWWRQDKTNILTEAAARDYRVVLCPRLPTYLNYVQNDFQKVGRRWKKIFNSMDHVYDFPDKLIADNVPAGKEKNIIGIEGCLWTEFVPDRSRADYMIFPRLAAIAEDAWTPSSRKNEANFMSRLPAFVRELERRQIPHYDPFNPLPALEPPGCTNQDYTLPPTE
jgi:hexosaminidase